MKNFAVTYRDWDGPARPSAAGRPVMAGYNLRSDNNVTGTTKRCVLTMESGSQHVALLSQPKMMPVSSRRCLRRRVGPARREDALAGELEAVAAVGWHGIQAAPLARPRAHVARRGAAPLSLSPLGGGDELEQALAT